MISFEIKQDAEGIRVLKYLSRAFPKAPESLLHRLIRQKKIKVNRKRTESSYRLLNGDIVEVWLNDEKIRELSGEDSVSDNPKREYEALKDRVSVIFEDDDIIVLDKPAGVLSQKASPDDISLNGFLTGYMLETGKTSISLLKTVRPSVLSRLDRNTSGLVLCGKTVKGEQKVSEMLRDRSVQKYYLAGVHGMPPESSEETAYLSKDNKKNMVTVTDKPLYPDSREIRTGFRCISRDRLRDISLMLVELITGRPHQIRAHMAFLGYPLIGDTKYGDRDRDRLLLSGKGELYLHSFREIFPDGKTVEAPVPDRFRKLFKETDIE
ncbi:MAG: RluA family pseudouridine synthase [Lachnospiraceae bacterium]|nr:RluA family pseudouridine synthase [Lachnospiraceae bacterium]